MVHLFSCVTNKIVVFSAVFTQISSLAATVVKWGKSVSMFSLGNNNLTSNGASEMTQGNFSFLNLTYNLMKMELWFIHFYVFWMCLSSFRFFRFSLAVKERMYSQVDLTGAIAFEISPNYGPAIGKQSNRPHIQSLDIGDFYINFRSRRHVFFFMTSLERLLIQILWT